MSGYVLGVIGGSGIYDVPGLEVIAEELVETPFGAPSDRVVRGRHDGHELLFLPRHGRGHTTAPHRINYRANVAAMKQLGATHLVSISAVGSMKEDIAPGNVVIVDQYIDLTKRRVSTFFEDDIVAHVAFSDPVCPLMAGAAADAVRRVGGRVHVGGTYVCMEGPQFSTRAESLLYRSWGVSVIGMTAMPEAKLAREAELPYATIALSTDYDCWHESEEAVNVDAVVAVLNANASLAKKAVLELGRRPARSGEEPGSSRPGSCTSDPARRHRPRCARAPRLPRQPLPRDSMTHDPSTAEPVLIVGSMAFDDLELPTENARDVIGGSATYAGFAVSLFAPARVVAVVGDDFPEAALDRLRDKNVDCEGIERAKGKTFRWVGRYSKNLTSRETLDTQLNVFADFRPKLPASYRKSPFVLLGNIHPALQLEVLAQAESPRFVAADTMNFWIEGERSTLEKLLAKIDTLVINDEELRQLAGEHNVRRAAAAVRSMGPKRLVVKRGEYGAMLFDEHGIFFAPAFPARGRGRPHRRGRHLRRSAARLSGAGADHRSLDVAQSTDDGGNGRLVLRRGSRSQAAGLARSC